MKSTKYVNIETMKNQYALPSEQFIKEVNKQTNIFLLYFTKYNLIQDLKLLNLDPFYKQYIHTNNILIQQTLLPNVPNIELLNIIPYLLLMEYKIPKNFFYLFYLQTNEKRPTTLPFTLESTSFGSSYCKSKKLFLDKNWNKESFNKEFWKIIIHNSFQHKPQKKVEEKEPHNPDYALEFFRLKNIYVELRTEQCPILLFQQKNYQRDNLFLFSIFYLLFLPGNCLPASKLEFFFMKSLLVWFYLNPTHFDDNNEIISFFHVELNLFHNTYQTNPQISSYHSFCSSFTKNSKNQIHQKQKTKDKHNTSATETKKNSNFNHLFIKEEKNPEQMEEIKEGDNILRKQFYELLWKAILKEGTADGATLTEKAVDLIPKIFPEINPDKPDEIENKYNQEKDKIYANFEKEATKILELEDRIRWYLNDVELTKEKFSPQDWNDIKEFEKDFQSWEQQEIQQFDLSSIERSFNQLLQHQQQHQQQQQHQEPSAPRQSVEKRDLDELHELIWKANVSKDDPKSARYFKSKALPLISELYPKIDSENKYQEELKHIDTNFGHLGEEIFRFQEVVDDFFSEVEEKKKKKKKNILQRN